MPTLPKADMEGEGDTPLLVSPLLVPLPPLLLRLMPPMGPVGGGAMEGLGGAFSCDKWENAWIKETRYTQLARGDHITGLRM